MWRGGESISLIIIFLYSVGKLVEEELEDILGTYVSATTIIKYRILGSQVYVSTDYTKSFLHSVYT